MQKCPNCGFEPVEGCTTCPKCGFSLQLNDQEEIKDSNNDKNDTIEWSELADMPIESVQKMFKDNEDKMKEENSKNNSEEIPEMNPILAQYIREHKDDQDKIEDTETENTEKVNETESDDVETNTITENESIPDNESEEVDISKNADEPVIQDSADESSEVNDESEETETLPVSEDVVSEDSINSNDGYEASDITQEDDSNNEGIIPPDNASSVSEPPKKNRKSLYITLAAIAVLGIGGGYYYYHEKEVEAQRIATVKKENEALDSIGESISSYYTDDKQVFLANDKVALNTSKIDEELSRYKENKRYDETKKAYDQLVAKQKAEQSVNQLFTSAAINGDKIVDNPLLKTAEPVDLSISTGDKEFDELMNQAINKAKDQYTKIESAKKATDGLLKDGNVIETVNRDQYNAANNAIKAVANQELVQTQKDELTKVDQALKEKEKKAAEEKAAADKAAREKEEQERAAQEAQKTTSTDSSQAGDTSSDAYAWAPGVKEKVIQTCISRGYIVEGGYSLEPVKIENGEGYYNLYATSNRASLTQGYTSSDLPMYLVTINCKTGWFKGDGPN